MLRVFCILLILALPASAADHTGTRRSAEFRLESLVPFAYGIASDAPLVGDWNGDGIDTVGVFRSGAFFLRNSNTAGYADVAFSFGQAGDVPVAGDWDGDGVTTVGLYRQGWFYLRNSNTAGPPDLAFTYGIPGDLPVTGDWNGDGKDTIGIWRAGLFYLRNSNTTGYGEVHVTAPAPGQPVAGDFDGDGRDELRLLQVGADERAFAGNWGPPPPPPCGSGPNIINIKTQFGARGDGTTDDFRALREAAGFMSRLAQTGKTLLFPAGTYKIGRHAVRHQNGSWEDSVDGLPVEPKITYRNAKNIRIVTCGPVVIDVEGAFLAGDDGAGTYRSQITPFNFEYCEGVTLEGFEIQGNVQRMSRRSPSEYACTGYGVMSRANTRLRLLGLNIHHFSCDGILLGYWTYKGDGVDRDIRIEHTQSHHNARNGLSILSVVGALIRSSQFTWNGYTESAGFAELSTFSGVDIEPEDGSSETPPVDEITFQDSTLQHNRYLDLRIWPYMEHSPPPQIRDVYLINTAAPRTYVSSIGGAVLHRLSAPPAAAKSAPAPKARSRTPRKKGRR